MAAIADVWQLLQPWLRTEGVEGTRGAPTHSTGLHPLRTGGAEGAHEAPANSTELHPLRTEGAGGPQGDRRPREALARPSDLTKAKWRIFSAVQAQVVYGKFSTEDTGTRPRNRNHKELAMGGAVCPPAKSRAGAHACSCMLMRAHACSCMLINMHVQRDSEPGAVGPSRGPREALARNGRSPSGGSDEGREGPPSPLPPGAPSLLSPQVAYWIYKISCPPGKS